MSTPLPNCFYNIGGWTTKDEEKNYVAIPGTLAVCSTNGTGAALYPGEKNWWTGNAWVLLGGDGQVDARVSNVSNQAAFTSISDAYSAVYPISDFRNRALRVARPLFTHSTNFLVPAGDVLRIYIPQGAQFVMAAPIILGSNSSLVIEGESSDSIFAYSAAGQIFFGAGSQVTIKSLTLQKSGVHSQFLFADSTPSKASLQHVTLIPGPSANLIGNLTAAQDFVITDCVVESDVNSRYVVATPLVATNHVEIYNMSVTGVMDGLWLQVDLAHLNSAGGIWGIYAEHITSGTTLTLVCKVSILSNVLLSIPSTSSTYPTIDISDIRAPALSNINTGNLLFAGAPQTGLYADRLFTNVITVGTTVTEWFMTNFLVNVGIVLTGGAPPLTRCYWVNGGMYNTAFSNVTDSTFSNIVSSNIVIYPTCARIAVTNMTCTDLLINSSNSTFTGVNSAGLLIVDPSGVGNKVSNSQFTTFSNVNGPQTVLEAVTFNAPMDLGSPGDPFQASGSLLTNCVFSNLSLYASNCTVSSCLFLTGMSGDFIRGSNNVLSQNQITQGLNFDPTVHPSINTLDGNVIGGPIVGTGNNTTDTLQITGNVLLSTLTLTNFVGSLFSGNTCRANVTFVGGSQNTATGNNAPGIPINMGVGVSSAAVTNRTSLATADFTASNF